MLVTFLKRVIVKNVHNLYQNRLKYITPNLTRSKYPIKNLKLLYKSFNLDNTIRYLKKVNFLFVVDKI